MINRFPVDLASGRLAYSNIHEIEVGGEKVVVNYRYLSPKGGEDGIWGTMEYLFLRKIPMNDDDYFVVYDLEGKSEILVNENCSRASINDETACMRQPSNVKCIVKENEVTIDFGGGRRRIYEVVNEYWLTRSHRLLKERTAKGNWLIYYYRAKCQLERVDVVSGDLQKVLASVNFRYQTNRLEDPSVIVSVNGKNQCFFRYKKLGSQYLLVSIEDDNGIVESYKYREKTKKHRWKTQEYRLNKIEYANGTFLGFVYRKEDGKIDSIWGNGSCGQGVQLAKISYLENGATLSLGNGNVEEYKFDDRGRTVFSKWGRISQWSKYNDFGSLVSRKSMEGKKKLLERNLQYDDSLNVTCDEIVAEDERIATKYEYDSLGRVERISHSHGLEELFTYLKDTSLVSKNQIGITTNCYEYDEWGNLMCEEEDDQSFVHKYRAYKREGSLVSEIEVGVINRDTHLKECDHSDRFSYDFNGNLICKEVLDSVGDVTFTEEFTYTKKMNVSEKRSSSGQGVIFTYDDLGKLITEVSGDLSVEYKYDACGRVREKERYCSGRDNLTTQYKYDCFGQLVFTKTERGEKIEYAYDELDRRIKDESGTYRFDIFGKKAYVRDFSGRVTQIENGLFNEPKRVDYPDGGWEVCRQEEGGRRKIFVDQAGVQKECVYDEYSRLLTSTCEDRSVEYQYSGKKLSAIIENGDLIAKFTYDGLGRIEEEGRLGRIRKYSYNHVGHLSHLEENGCLTIFERDGLGRVIKKWVGKSVFTYEYDESGECCSWGRGEADEKLTWRQVFDGFGDLKMEYGPNGAITHYVRNGLYVEKIDPLRRVEVSKYNERGLLVERRLDESDIEDVYTYDEVGNTLSHQKTTGKNQRAATFKYDEFNRSLAVSDYFGKRSKGYTTRGEIAWERRDNGALIFFEYNVHGELIHVSSDDGTISYRYQYDRNGDVSKTINEVTNRTSIREYDGMRRLVKEILENGLEIKYEYERGRKSIITLPDGTSIHYVYDQGEICRVYRSDRSGEFLYDSLIELDSRGKVKRETMIENLGVIEKRYDRDLRLKMITSPYHHESAVAIDLVGNILGVKGSDRELEFKVDRLDQIVGALEVNGFYQREDSPKRDSGGRVVEFDGKSFVYDGFDRLVELSFEGKKVRFVHDAYNRIVQREVDGKIERYFYDEMLEIGAVNEEGEIAQLRVLGYGKKGDIGKAVALEINHKVYAPLHDLFGNIVGVVDSETGKIAGKWSTTIYGKEVLLEGVVSPWRFQSKRVEEVSGVIIFGLRTYLPTVATFCQLDEREVGKVTNLTHFNFNNPLRFSDAWGLDSASLNMQRINLHLDNTYVTPQLPFSEWILEQAHASRAIYTASEEDIRHYPGRDSDDRQSAIVVVNGIRNCQCDCRELADKIAAKYSGKIVSIYNRSCGTWNDLQRVGSEFASKDTAPVINLRSALIDLHEKGYQNIHLINHSEGGLIAKRALECLSQDVRDKMNIISIASPSMIPRCYGKSVINYYSSNDSIRSLARVSSLIDKLAGHQVDFECFQSQIGKFGEHSIHCPTYSIFLDQVVESIENAS